MHGSYIPFAKLQAMIIGDLSGAFIHPFFIHFAEVSGCHFYQYNRSDFSLLQHQGELLRATYEALDTMRPEDDPLAYAQAQIYMSMAVMNTGNIKVAMNHLRKGANTIKTFNIRFVPLGVGGNANVVQEVGGYSEVAHERAVFLSKILHFEAYLSLYVMGLPGIQSFNVDRDTAKASVRRPKFDVRGAHRTPLSISLRKECKRVSRISATIWSTNSGMNCRLVSPCIVSLVDLTLRPQGCVSRALRDLSAGITSQDHDFDQGRPEAYGFGQSTRCIIPLLCILRPRIW